MRNRILPEIDVILGLLKTKTQKEIAILYGVSEAAVSQKLTKYEEETKAVPESFKSLSEKQQKFVIEKVSGKSNTQAALVAYDCGSRDSAKALGSELMKDQKVQTAMKDIVEEEGLTDRHLARRLKHWVDSKDGNYSLRAIEQSLKVKGLYPAEKQPNGNTYNFTKYDLTLVRPIQPDSEQLEDKAT